MCVLYAPRVRVRVHVFSCVHIFMRGYMPHVCVALTTPCQGVMQHWNPITLSYKGRWHTHANVWTARSCYACKSNGSEHAERPHSLRSVCCHVYTDVGVGCFSGRRRTEGYPGSLQHFPDSSARRKYGVTWLFVSIPTGKAFLRWTWTSILLLKIRFLEYLQISGKICTVMEYSEVRMSRIWYSIWLRISNSCMLWDIHIVPVRANQRRKFNSACQVDFTLEMNDHSQRQFVS